MEGRVKCDDDERVIVYSDDEDEECNLGGQREGEKRSEVVIEGFTPGPNAEDVLEDGTLWKVEVLAEGQGEFGVEPGMWVVAHYKGWILEKNGETGDCVEDTRNIGLPMTFSLGAQDARGYRAIAALEYSLWGMKIEEKAVFIAHHELGYKPDRRSGNCVPFGSNLKLEVEVLDFFDNLGMGEDDTDVIRYRINPPSFEGEGGDQPKQGAYVKADIVGEYEGRVFDEREVSWFLGLEKQYDLPPGIGKAVKSFVVEEKSRLVLKGKMGFGAEGCRKFDIPAYSTVTYVVTLLDFANSVELMDQVSVAERVVYCTKLNEAAQDEFEKNRFSQAIEYYSRAKQAAKRDTILLKVIPADQDQMISEILINATVGTAKCYLSDPANNYIPQGISMLEEILQEEEQYFQQHISKLGQIYVVLIKCYIEGKEFGKGQTILDKLDGLKINTPEKETLGKRLRHEAAVSNEQDVSLAKRMLELGR